MSYRQSRTRWIVMVWLVCSIVGALSFVSQVHAKLPPRPTKTPVSQEKESTPEPLAGTIMLNMQPVRDGLWSVVQWYDSDEQWHDVEGWSGTVVGGKTIWWVEQGHWGKTPYRWVVFQEQGGAQLGISESFTLPDSGKTLVVTVDMPN